MELLRLVYYMHSVQVTGQDPTQFLWLVPKKVLVSTGESCSTSSTNPLPITRHTIPKSENAEPGDNERVPMGERVGVMGNWCLPASSFALNNFISLH